MAVGVAMAGLGVAYFFHTRPGSLAMGASPVDATVARLTGAGTSAHRPGPARTSWDEIISSVVSVPEKASHGRLPDGRLFPERPSTASAADARVEGGERLFPPRSEGEVREDLVTGDSTLFDAPPGWREPPVRGDADA
ncbi:MAG: hypothetical protein KatS3mg008_2202 [Acidimicrobiales bacterium]|nr:MAG: hypothetical protein KatS3mg008_2202 [Acidimicrobiales bacterium]